MAKIRTYEMNRVLVQVNPERSLECVAELFRRVAVEGLGLEGVTLEGAASGLKASVHGHGNLLEVDTWVVDPNTQRQIESGPSNKVAMYNANGKCPTLELLNRSNVLMNPASLYQLAIQYANGDREREVAQDAADEFIRVNTF